MSTSRIPGFHKLSLTDRVRVVRDRGLLSAASARALLAGEPESVLTQADAMIENVIGVMWIPVGLAVNLLVNGKDYVVPLAVEEPSIVGALSFGAKLARSGGGVHAGSTAPILIGQVQLVGVSHASSARQHVVQRKDEIINLANSLHPRLVARGGGAVDVEAILHPANGDSPEMLVVHLLVDTRDAMGANLVNTMCEGVAPFIESITGGSAFLKIMSNLADRALVTARLRVPVEDLAGSGFTGEDVRDRIVIASQFAAADPYRATTHNKGIMNGIDAVALATGNDWRALEASAHAWAARGNRYTSLTRWSRGEDGALEGFLEMPIKVGTVGGSQSSNPAVTRNLEMLKVGSACELAEVMGAVGLCQNLAALRALATEGIQPGHMTLHARSLAAAAGATPEILDTVVSRIVTSGEVKMWKAEEVVREVQAEAADRLPSSPPELAVGHGKIILLGEHAVVYGSRAIAAPIPLAVRARVTDTEDGVWLVVPRWGVEHRLHADPARRSSFERPAAVILEELGLAHRAMRIEVYAEIPRAMGLGGSAAIAVAIIRALDLHFELGLSDEQVNALAYRSERVAHGTPSGIDNTVATYGRPLLFRAGSPPEMRHLSLPRPISFVVGMTGVESLTARTVARVREGWSRHRAVYDRIFEGIDALAGVALEAIEGYDLERLGEVMNVCHGLLNGLGVSSPELEELLGIARTNGALGAKLTGGGGGGSMIALSEGDPSRIAHAIRAAGHQALEVEVG